MTAQTNSALRRARKTFNIQRCFCLMCLTTCWRFWEQICAYLCWHKITPPSTPKWTPSNMMTKKQSQFPDPQCHHTQGWNSHMWGAAWLRRESEESMHMFLQHGYQREVCIKVRGEPHTWLFHPCVRLDCGLEIGRASVSSSSKLDSLGLAG